MPAQHTSSAAAHSASTTIAAIPHLHPLAFYPAGAEIYAQGERAGSLYKVEFGAVRVYRLLADGRRQIAAFHLADEVFGFEADRVHHFFAEAINACGIRVIHGSAQSNVSSDMLQIALQGLVRAQEHLLVLGRQNALERVAAFLVDLANRMGDILRLEMPMTRTDIADYLGLTIETISRVFSKLKEQGVIRTPSMRTIEISKFQTLKAICQ